MLETSLVVRQLRIHFAKKKKNPPCSAGDADSIPSRWTEILHVEHLSWCITTSVGAPQQRICMTQRRSRREREVAQSCLTLCNPMNCSLPGSSVHGIFQTRVLEWVAISFSRGSSQPRDQTRVSLTAGRRFTVWATREAPECSTKSQRSQINKYIFSKRPLKEKLMMMLWNEMWL